MPDKNIATYLNDHMAGSVVALELLKHLEKAHAGAPVERFAADLASEIEMDRKELEELMGELGVSASLARKAAAWLAEKTTELKLKFDDPAGSLRLLETAEIISLGIEGKRGLWKALAKASTQIPSLIGPNYDRLETRAQEQREKVEKVRLEAAIEAFRS